MHSVLAEVLACLDRSREGLRSAAEDVPAHLREESPGPQRWSVAGVIEHLALVEERFTAIIAAKIDEIRAGGAGQEDEVPDMLPPKVAAMLADRSERRSAPDPVHPRGLGYGEAWQRLEAARQKLRDTLSSGDGLALSRVAHEHPRFGALTPYQWAGFIAAHESRHTEQIREIAIQLARAR